MKGNMGRGVCLIMLRIPAMVPIEVGEEKLVAYSFNQGDLPSLQISSSINFRGPLHLQWRPGRTMPSKLQRVVSYAVYPASLDFLSVLFDPEHTGGLIDCCLLAKALCF